MWLSCYAPICGTCGAYEASRITAGSSGTLSMMSSMSLTTVISCTLARWTGLEDWMLEHNQRVEVILRQGTEGVTASLINKADCFWCFFFLGFSICTASGCLVGFRGWMSLTGMADTSPFTTCLNLKICCCCSRSICSRHQWGLTVPASLRSLVLLEIPAILSGMLYSFDYSFDHQETKFTGLPLGCSYQDNL